MISAYAREQLTKMCRYSKLRDGLGKRSCQIFIIAFAMTSVGPVDANAGDTLEATGRKAIANAKVVVDEVQEKAQEFTVNVILGSKDAIHKVSTLGRWTSALTERAAYPIRRTSDMATWGRERPSQLPVHGKTVHEADLAIHQRFTREVFLRLSVSMDEEPVFTGSGDAHPAVGLSFIRPFE